jgi:hypothetical protein
MFAAIQLKKPVVYFPYHQGYPLPEDMVFELRTAGDPLTYVNAVHSTFGRRLCPRKHMTTTQAIGYKTSFDTSAGKEFRWTA